MKQVWIDYQFWNLFTVWPGAIAGHVRSAIRIYLTLRKQLDIPEGLEGNAAEIAIFIALNIPPEAVDDSVPTA